MADENCTVTIFPSDVLDIEGNSNKLWHWKRLNENGAQIDGSGGQRNGLQTKKAAIDLVKGKYPDDKITA
jgi:hypothetical protein